ncbi:cobalt ECF transporter T component CbiQ [Clostridium felsineum]|uniref:Energy-coupling factor transporter transmembrane protein EcfT n=1 Tax=Clostridium felsineum TaxID=36839 RepID=A0A1S8LQ70_9CLOT|nr:cobalt ECF transporter T component CbiQ [Clostridium felsineum]MCR3757687.1 cobalt ECF transporter T component CbiQ [Clostridium felsineum]URZ01068.1 Energy-coupling factor transporter transmembrane protein EcfT [Clostridium felsineum]URZ06182.1 Energy-coupling factor transporter transmembrane protein EcfT [Clostridium felsineum]URZ11217.1 Energy-coupling factor transporter transmembrane protein EcfT [Clostridium felsineum]
MSLLEFKNTAEVESFVHRFDGRVKTIIFFISIITVVMLSKWYVILSFWILSLLLFFSAGIKMKKLIHRLSMPVLMAVIVFINVSFTNGSHCIYTLNLGFKLNIYLEGLQFGSIVFLRVIAAVTLGYLLIYTTPMTEILETLRILKVPTTIIDIANMMYRYLFIIEEVRDNMNRAQISRMGKNASTYKRLIDSGKTAAYVLIKSLDKSTSIYKAMISRGYNTETTHFTFFREKIRFQDKVFIILAIAFISIEIIANQM